MCARVCACVWCTAPTCCALVPFEVGSGWSIRTAKTTTQENTFHENKPVAGLVVERERDVTNAVPPHLRRDVFRYPGDMASTRGGLISVWPCASEESESTLREADVLATLPMYDPGLLASWYRRRYGSALCRWVDLGRRQKTCAALMSISRHQHDSNSIPPDRRNGTLPTDLTE